MRQKMGRIIIIMPPIARRLKTLTHPLLLLSLVTHIDVYHLLYFILKRVVYT